jgi:hypothetical protein
VIEIDADQVRIVLRKPGKGADGEVEFPRFSGRLITCAVVARKDGVCAEDPTRVSR